MANNILLLEDDMSLIDGLQYSLKKNGYAVEVARTVSEAKRLLQNIDQYDLLILDVTLPDGTGFEICEMVRNRNEQIPIIFLTASETLPEYKNAFSTGNKSSTFESKIKLLFYHLRNCLWRKVRIIYFHVVIKENFSIHTFQTILHIIIDKSLI